MYVNDIELNMDFDDSEENVAIATTIMYTRYKVMVE